MSNEQKPLAKRNNKGKLEWSSFPLFLIRPLIKVSQSGIDEYGKYNFLEGGPTSQYTDCMTRHLDAFTDPHQPDNDEKSGCNHLAHAAWNALVAIYMLEHRPELDDRYKIEGATDNKRMTTDHESAIKTVQDEEDFSISGNMDIDHAIYKSATKIAKEVINNQSSDKYEPVQYSREELFYKANIPGIIPDFSQENIMRIIKPVEFDGNGKNKFKLKKE